MKVVPAAYTVSYQPDTGIVDLTNTGGIDICLRVPHAYVSLRG